MDGTKMKALQDDKLNVAKMAVSVYARIEKIVGKAQCF